MTSGRRRWNPLRQRLIHRTQRALEIGTGLGFVSPFYQTLHRLRFRSVTGPLPIPRTALVAHVFYPDLWPEIASTWQAMPAGSPLIITTPHGTKTQILARAGANSLIEIYESDNRGRDIAPFVGLLNAGQLDRFDVVLKIHTKKSPHLRQGDLRRRVFFTALAGHPGNVCRILRQFGDPRVGLVGLAPFFRTRPSYWMGDKALVEDLCRRMEPEPPVRLGFFEGSMFWVRPLALAPLRSLDLRPEDFDVETGQLDAALHHAVERTFTLSALAAGYESRSILGKTLLAPEPASEAINPSAIRRKPRPS